MEPTINQPDNPHAVWKDEVAHRASVAAPTWAPPAPPAPKKERQWLIPTIGLAVVLVLAAGVGITVAATGSSATAATTTAAPTTTLYTTTAAPTTVPYAGAAAQLIVDNVWRDTGAAVCRSMNELVADGVPRATVIEMGMTEFERTYDGPWHDEVKAAMRHKLELC